MAGRDIDLQHGIADQFWPNSLPCNQVDPTGTGKVACVCDGTSYFPVQSPAQYMYTKDKCAGKSVKRVHSDDISIAACSSIGPVDRLTGDGYPFSKQVDPMVAINEIREEMRSQVKPQIVALENRQEHLGIVEPDDNTKKNWTDSNKWSVLVLLGIIAVIFFLVRMYRE